MEKRLRLNNTPVWNLCGLQKAFSPIEIYDQLQEYLRFVSVHCVFLASKLQDAETGTYDAEYLTKEFWLDVLRTQDSGDEKPEKRLDAFLKKSWEAQAEGLSREEQRKAIEAEAMKEAADAQLREKLAHICKTGSLEADGYKAVMLLAICEIAEMDARKHNFEVQTGPEAKTDAQTADQNEAKLVSDAEEEILTANGTHYRFLYHDEEILRPGARIRTVTIRAKNSVNRYERAVIELYSEKEKRCVQTVNLKAGEYRRCNVSEGRIIKFLPDVSIENGCCLYRKKLASQTVTMEINGKLETLTAENITGFTALSAGAGCIVLCDGKLNIGKCKAMSDWKTELMLDAICNALNVVEIAQLGQTVRILTASGNIYNILQGDNGVYRWLPLTLKKPEKSGCTSLCGATRAPGISSDHKDAIQAAVSGDRTQAAVLMGDGRCEILRKGSFLYLQNQNKIAVGGSV